MTQGLWWRVLCRRIRRTSAIRTTWPRRVTASRRRAGISPLFLTLFVGGLTAWVLIAFLEAGLRPIVRDAAQYQIQNRVVSTLEYEITREMTAYGPLVEVQRGENGHIISLTADTAALNLLRADLVSGILEAMEDLGVMEVEVPLGNVLDSELIWGRGPAIQVRSTVLGSVDAEFDSSFSSAGINQTLHRIWLEIRLPVRLFLPGGPADITVETQLTVAETVIVGEIPDLVFTSGLESTLTS